MKTGVRVRPQTYNFYNPKHLTQENQENKQLKMTKPPANKRSEIVNCQSRPKLGIFKLIQKTKQTEQQEGTITITQQEQL